MTTPIIPHTSPHASINRIAIVDLPGLPLDPEVRGAQAYHLLSAPAIVRYALQHADALDLPPALRAQDPESPEARYSLPRYVDACLGDTRPTVRATAASIARRLGRNLGYILLTLQRGDGANRSARQDWTASEWACWAAVRRVWLGGGIMGGSLGKALLHHANALVQELGAEAITLARTPYPQEMVLLGAGRYAPPEADHVLCLDLGQTGVKRAILSYESGALRHMRPLAPRPVHWRWRSDPQAAQTIDPEEVLETVTEVIAHAWTEAVAEGFTIAPDVMLGIAAYVRDGELLGNGVYARLMQLSSDVRPLLADAVRRHHGVDVRVHPIHDGVAAAACHAGAPAAAVLTIGTALGAGFPPAEVGALRPLASRLEILPAR